MEGLKKLDSLEVISIVDNSIATWSDPERKDVQRFFKWVKAEEDEDKSILVADRGLCLHLRATLGEEEYTILYDTGDSPRNLENNIVALGLDLSNVDAIVLSHGHMDHFGGLLWTLNKIGKRDLPVYVHPWMFLKKGFEIDKPEGKKIREMPVMPSIHEIRKAGGKVNDTAEPVLLGNGLLMRTGEVPRVTSYEKGMSSHRVFIEGEWKKEADVREDVSLVANVKGKGLVVISGCSHAGIINIIRETQQLTGESRVHAVIGGLHLASGVTKDTMLETVKKMKAISPKLLVPCHCTGWRARHLMSAEMPNEYVEGSVGHKYIIGRGDVS
jgi:7,8-dihydropterin-6-yl-methyl-4-(beta-D-ribofuranosyl)aminobenzene 5'-phosphate synthase